MIEKPIFVPVDFNPFEKEPRFRTAPTTEPQREIFTNVQLGGNAANCAYNESVSLKLKGDFDFSALQKAADLLLQRHEALRASFSKDGTYIQISQELSIRVPVIDLSSLPEHEKKLEEELIKEAETPFDLENGPLIRLSVIKLP